MSGLSSNKRAEVLQNRDWSDSNLIDPNPMRVFGGTIAWLGGMSLILGLMFYILSLKNPSDLFIWAAIGMVMSGGGFLMMIIGWMLYGAANSGQSDA